MKEEDQAVHRWFVRFPFALPEHAPEMEFDNVFLRLDICSHLEHALRRANTPDARSVSTTHDDTVSRTLDNLKVVGNYSANRIRRRAELLTRPQLVFRLRTVIFTLKIAPLNFETCRTKTRPLRGESKQIVDDMSSPGLPHTPAQNAVTSACLSFKSSGFI